MLLRTSISLGKIRRKPRGALPSFFKRSLQSTKYSSNYTNQFLQIFNIDSHQDHNHGILKILCDENSLKKKLEEIDIYIKDNYIHEQFISWLSKYSQANTNLVQSFFNGHTNFESIWKDFIKFCLNHDISLCPKKTLDAFTYHNELSNQAVNRELSRLQPKENINLLGFGLDEGIYEKEIAHYLRQNGIAQKVVVYGFDPYANKKNGILYLDKNQLKDPSAPSFDLITCRWVLHHVAEAERWDSLISCINLCNPHAKVLIVEHGFQKQNISPKERRISDFFNGLFDIIANIGLRPNYLTNNFSNSKSDFFIKYLRTSDFRKIINGLPVNSTEHIYDVGPGFPNQTICSIKVGSPKM